MNDEEVRDVKEKEDKLQTLPSDIYNLMNGVEDVIEIFWFSYEYRKENLFSMLSQGELFLKNQII